MSLLVVGSVAYDSVATPEATADEILRGSATYFSISASFFTKVKLVAVVGEDFRKEDRSLLESRGIDLRGLETVKGRTFRWKGDYTGNLNEAVTLDTQLNVFAGFRPRLTAGFKRSRNLFLANIDPELQLAVTQQVVSPRVIACDTMNFWIGGKPKALGRLLKRIDLLLINDAEALQLSGKRNLVQAAYRILSMGPKTVVIKRGEYGALLFQRDQMFAVPAYPLETVVDPTGAGDTFAGGFMGYLARSRSTGIAALRRAMVYGSVMASFNVEDFGMGRLKGLDRDQIRIRYRAFRELTSF